MKHFCTTFHSVPALHYQNKNANSEKKDMGLWFLGLERCTIAETLHKGFVLILLSGIIYLALIWHSRKHKLVHSLGPWVSRGMAVAGGISSNDRPCLLRAKVPKRLWVKSVKPDAEALRHQSSLLQEYEDIWDMSCSPLDFLLRTLYCGVGEDS